MITLNDPNADELVRQWVDRLDKEWLTEQGFFWRVRDGDYDVDLGEAICKLLEAIELPDDGPVDRRLERRLVSGLYFISTYMEWQNAIVEKKGGDIRRYVSLTTRMRHAVRKILEYPVELPPAKQNTETGK